jgi:hypothetical protein
VEEDWKAACHRVVELLTNEGLGHTLVIHPQSGRHPPVLPRKTG